MSIQHDFYNLIQNIQIPIYIFTKQNYIFANTAFLNLFNINKQDLIDNPLYFKNTILPSDISIFNNIFNEFINTKHPITWTSLANINNKQLWLKFKLNNNENQIILTVQDITDQKHAIKVLSESEWRLQGLLDGATTVAVQGYKMDGTVVYWNDAAVKFYGYTKEEALGNNLLDLIIPKEAREIVKEELRIMSTTGNPIPSSQLDLVRKDGSIISVYSSHSLIEIPSQGSELFCIDTDLSEIKEKEKELLKAQKVGEVGTWKIILNGNNNINGSSEFYKLLNINNTNNLTLKELIKDYVYVEDKELFENNWNHILNNEQSSITFEFRTSYDNGNTWLKSTNEIDEYINNKPYSILGTIHNITREKNYAMHLEEIAYKDYLTGLLNKYSFEQEIEKILKSKNPIVCVHYIDIDGLYNINSQMNDAIGDHVICATATRLSEYSNNLDYNSILSCLGGGVFGLAIQDKFCLDNINNEIEKIQELISKPITISGDTLYITASVGTSYIMNNQVHNVSYLLRTAENALYQSKLKGKNKHTCFSIQKYFLDTNHQARLEDIRKAVLNDEFVLFYQPKVNILTNELFGFEALIRWNHPSKGIVSPGEFIPYIEGHPLIVEIGDWVINAALKQQKEWDTIGLNFGSISVNISSIQFEHPLFVDKLKKSITTSSIKDVSKLDLEILESGPILNLDESPGKFNNIKQLGIKISLDDFGTGHSSLQFLKSIKPDIIKIDRSFILNIEKDNESKTIVQAILDLGKIFNAKVIAEGLETEEHKKILLELGCIYAQGYGLGRPMPANEVLKWLDNFNN